MLNTQSTKRAGSQCGRVALGLALLAGVLSHAGSAGANGTTTNRLLWAQHVADPVIVALATGPAREIVVTTGWQPNSGKWYVNGAYTIRLRKFDNGGGLQWTRKIGRNTAFSFGIDSTGRIYYATNVSRYATFSRLAPNGDLQRTFSVLFEAPEYDSGTYPGGKLSGTFVTVNETDEMVWLAETSYDGYGRLAPDGTVLVNKLPVQDERDPAYGRIRKIAISPASGRLLAFDKVDFEDGGYDAVEDRELGEYRERCRPFAQFFDNPSGVGSSPSKSRILDFAVDATDSIVVAGPHWGARDEYNRFTRTDAVLAKCAPNGTVAWTRILDSRAYDAANAVDIDASGNIFACGATAGALAGRNRGRMDAWIAKFNAAGEILWKQQWGSAASDVCTHLDVDRNGDVVVGGTTEGGLTGPVTDKTAFIAKFRGA